MNVSAVIRFCLATEDLEFNLMQESDGVIAKEHVGSSGDGGIGDCTTKVSQVSCTYGQSVALYVRVNGLTVFQGKDDNPSTGAEDVGVAELEERTEVCFC